MKEYGAVHTFPSLHTKTAEREIKTENWSWYLRVNPWENATSILEKKKPECYVRFTESHPLPALQARITAIKY